MTGNDNIKVLAVASIGGHWEQLMMMRDLFEQYDSEFVTTDAKLFDAYGVRAGHAIPDCNRDTPFVVIKAIFQIHSIMRKVQPDIVISTGALPGLLCIVIGRLNGAKAVWVDSIANAEHLSLCGRFAKYLANSCVTQWKHLADSPRISYFGSVL